MARQAVFTWLAANTTGVTSLQTLAGAGNLTINGPLVPSTGTAAVFQNVSRTVSLTSANNLSAVNVTITGIYGGYFKSETISGPNANTVYTTGLFDNVTSVRVDAAAAAISVGSGTTGQTHWFTHNYHATVIGCAIQVVVTGTINYSFQTTLDDAQLVSTVTPTVFGPIDGVAGSPGYPADMVGATTNQLAFVNNVMRFSNIIINSATTGTLVATFLQQGIT